MIPVKPKDTLWQQNSDINEFQISDVGEKLFENMCWCQFWNKFDSRVDHIVRNRMPFSLTIQIYLPYIYLVIYIHIGEKLKLVVKEILTSDWPGIGKLLLTLLQSEEIWSHVCKPRN